MPFGQLQNRKVLPVHPFGSRKYLSQRCTPRSHDVAGKDYPLRLELVDGPFDVLHANGDVMKGPVAELGHPRRDETGPPPGIPVRLVHKQGRESRRPVHLGEPIVVIQILRTGVSKPETVMRATIDGQRSGHMVMDRGFLAHGDWVEVYRENAPNR